LWATQECLTINRKCGLFDVGDELACPKWTGKFLDEVKTCELPKEDGKAMLDYTNRKQQAVCVTNRCYHANILLTLGLPFSSFGRLPILRPVWCNKIKYSTEKLFRGFCLILFEDQVIALSLCEHIPKVHSVDGKLQRW
jgi:hypothetical protein